MLRIDLQLEEQQKIQFAIANNALNEEKQKLVALSIRQRKYEREGKKLLEDVLDMQKIRENKQAINVMKSRIRDQMIKVSSAEKKVEFERERLNNLRVDRKTQEKLKEYAFDAYKKEFAMEEAREIDQTVTYNYSTKE